MPDREAHKEWGRLGSLSVRMLRKGFRIPPTGAFGVTQVQEWLESFSTYPAAIEAWRNWEGVEASLETLRGEIESTPMPAHWPLSCETLRRHLCGDQDWPLMLRPTFKRPQYEPAALHAAIAPSPSSENVWDAFKKLFLHIFTLPMAREIVLAGTDPAELRIAIVVQPEIAVNRDSALSLEAERDLKLKQKIAEKFLKRPTRLSTIWDGEQLWFLDARPSVTPKNIADRHVKHLLVDLDGTLLGARQVPLQLKFVGSFLKDFKQHGGWWNAVRALNSIQDELKKPSPDLMNSERAVKRFAEVIGKPVVVAQELYGPFRIH
jgi:hypothetical protein